MRRLKPKIAPSERGLSMPKLVYDVIEAPFSVVRPTNRVKRSHPVMLPTSKLLYSITDSDPTYPIKVKAPSDMTKIESQPKKIRVPVDPETKIINACEKKIKMGDKIKLEDYIIYETLGGAQKSKTNIVRY